VAVVIGAAFSNVIHAMVTDIINPSISHVVQAIAAAKEKTTQGLEQAAATVKHAAGTVGLAATTQPSTQPATGSAAPPTAVAAAPTTVPVAVPQLPADPQVAQLVTALKDAIKAQQPPPAPPPAPAAPDTVKAVNFDWVVAGYPIGHFIGELINFVIIAFAIFILIVKLLGGMVKRVGGTPKPGEPTTKECTECLSVIPIKARRCSHCTAEVEVPPETAPTATA
jgi:large-conductance mechanosensitive channel